MKLRRPGLAAVAWLILSAPSAAQNLLEFLLANLALERQLLEQDLAAHAQARREEEAAQERVATALERLDQHLAGDQVAPDQMVQLEERLDQAQASAAAAARQSRELRQQIAERIRRAALLQQRVDQERVAGASVQDPISGRWRVTISPLSQTGTFELLLTGSVVQGTYRLEGGDYGSLRGTYVNGVLTLDRIDSRRGFDVIYSAGLSPGRAELRGTWQPTELSGGGPAGEWTGVKLTRSGRGQP